MLVIFSLIRNKNQMKATEPRAWLDKSRQWLNKKKKVLAITKEF